MTFKIGLRSLLKNTLKMPNNFARFSLNYPHTFIEDCWGSDPRMAKHLDNKFHDAYLRHKTSVVMLMFYLGLDKPNQEILDAYIDNWAYQLDNEDLIFNNIKLD